MFSQQLGTIMILVLFSVVMLSLTTEPMRFPTGVWYLFALGGAIAGAISGIDRRGIVAALVGMGVAVFLFGRQTHLHE